MNVNTQLMQKNGIVAMNLAREISTMKVGDRLNTVAEYASIFNTARGTVQLAIKLLEQNNAIILEHRGHLGTYIKYIDYKVLWEFSGFGTIIGVMPLPYSKRYEGLATGLYKVASNNNIPFGLAYMRGAGARVQALQSGRYDFAVISKLAARNVIEKGMDIDIAMEFGYFTYVNSHAVIFSDQSKSEIEDGMRVGIDRSSIDHCLLTLKQCEGKDVVFVDLMYNQIITKIKSGELDAVVWNIDDILEKRLNIAYYPLDYNKTDIENTEAVLIVNRNSNGIKNLIEHFIDKETVIMLQKQVIDGLIVPSY